jgi:hypothetical protein
MNDENGFKKKECNTSPEEENVKNYQYLAQLIRAVRRRGCWVWK